MQYLNIKDEDRFLIVAPHPDDECIGTGGILTLYPKQCTVIVLTDGRQGQGNVAPEKEKSIRKQEFIEEMQCAGITSFQMLDYQDGTLMQHTDCLFGIDLSMYTKIFVTGMHDGHADHTAACISVFQAVRQQKAETAEVFLYEVHVPLREVTHVLDITGVLNKKVELIRFHKSQIQGIEYDKLAENLAWYRGLQNGMKGCCLEAYCVMKISDCLGDSSVELENQLQKFKVFYWVLTRWIELKQRGISMASLLRSRNYERIAIYGYAEIGQLLCQELCQEEFEVSYIMDKKVCEAGGGIRICTPEKNLPKVDAVVVTAVYYFDEIKQELEKMGFENVISFRDLVESQI